jgi:putative endonuclease
MKYYVYVIKSIRFDFTYVGHTEDLRSRLKEHNKGKTKSNKAYKPFLLVYFEEFKIRSEAIKREKYFKSGSGKEYLKEKLKNAPVPA